MRNECISIKNAEIEVNQAALEAAALNTAIGGYKFEDSKFELDPESTEGLNEREKEIVAQFAIPSTSGGPTAVIYQANEGLLDSLSIQNIGRVSTLIMNSISSIERNAKALTNMVSKMHNTLEKAQKKLKSVGNTERVDIQIDFGAYSRFFHIGNKTINTDKAFIEGLFTHRAASDWCAVNSTQVLKEVGAIVLDIFPSVQRTLPVFSEAIVTDAIDKVNNVFALYYSKDSLTGLGSSSSALASVKVPKQLQYHKDSEVIVKGIMFDGNVLTYAKPKKPSLNALSHICTISRDEAAARSEVKSFEIETGASLKAITEHGVQITSNIISNLDALKDYIDDYLRPMKSAISYVTKNEKLISSDDAKLLVHYACLARLLNDCVVHPLLTNVWVDTRLARVISGMVEAHFVPNPRDRVLFAKDIRAV